MFYTFRQNNSGGIDINDNKVRKYVIVEGISVEDINEKARMIGIYFNGVNEGIDCECCGDRWSECDDDYDFCTETPMVYDKEIQPALNEKRANVIIYYKDGSRAFGFFKWEG